MSAKHWTQISGVLAVMAVVAMGVAVFTRTPSAPTAPVPGSTQAAADTLCDPARPVVNRNDLNDWLTCRDLGAQQSMAVSTDLIATLTLISLALGAFTLIGLAVTILQTREALRRTSQEIEDNRDFSRVQLRAYLGQHEQVPSYSIGGPVRIDFDFKNFGQTPALNVRMWSTQRLIDGFPTDWCELPENLSLTPLADISPGATFGLLSTVTESLTPALDAKFKARTRSFVLAAVYVYEDVFGDTHVLKFCQIRSAEGLTRARRSLAFNTIQHSDLPKTASLKIRTVGPVSI